MILDKEFDTKFDAEYKILLNNESKMLHGKIVKWSVSKDKIQNLLLVGETNHVKNEINNIIKAEYVYTTGLNDVDFYWDFDNSPDIDKKFNLIISQAILEHLIDPFKHLKDLTELLHNEGCLIIHTVEPGFKYHKSPIDALRFYPDWFEKVALKLNLEIVKRGKIKYHIFYMLKRKLNG